MAARKRRNRDSSSKMIEFAIIHMMAGVEFKSIGRDSIEFSVPKVCRKDDLFWEATDIINSVKREFVKSCFSDSELVEISESELKDIGDMINFRYTIRDEEFTENETEEMLRKINDSLIKLNLNKSIS